MRVLRTSTTLRRRRGRWETLAPWHLEHEPPPPRLGVVKALALVALALERRPVALVCITEAPVDAGREYKFAAGVAGVGDRLEGG